MKSKFSRRSTPTLQEIANEWDNLCFARDHQIKHSIDISYQYVTTPYILNALKKIEAKTAVEIGCGTGRLAQEIINSTSITHIFAVDLSPLSIDLAQRNATPDVPISYKVAAADRLPTNEKYDVCFSNMVFMDDPNFSKSIKKISSIVKPGGTLVFTITHPCFWPYYWKYDRDEGFDYLHEQAILSEFKTSTTTSIGKTTHIHRPLEYYLNNLISNDFSITDFSELRPTGFISTDYEYNYPRFLGVTAQRISK